jgi:hypothetical protein
MDEATQRIFEETEGSEVRILANLASDLATFQKICGDLASVKRLRDLAKDEEGSKIVYTRLQELIEEPSEAQYLNVKDAALAIYLLVLDESGSYLSRHAVEAVLQMSNTLWARIMARKFQGTYSSLSTASMGPLFTEAMLATLPFHNVATRHGVFKAPDRPTDAHIRFVHTSSGTRKIAQLLLAAPVELSYLGSAS